MEYKWSTTERSVYLGQPLLRNPMSAHDKSLGGRTHKIERVTSHQGEDVGYAGAQHFDVIGPDHFDRVGAVAQGPVERRQGDFVIHVQVAQPAEERIPVSCERDVPVL